MANGRKEFLTIRGVRPRLHRTRFSTKIVKALPDKMHPVQPRPPAADDAETATATLSSPWFSRSHPSPTSSRVFHLFPSFLFNTTSCAS